MKAKLQYLYNLQQVDSQLDELEEEKGDLPRQVRALEETHATATAKLAALEKAMRDAFAARDEADSDILGLKEKVEKYRKQQFSVRNNKEYDALTREMDSAAETILRLEKEMELSEGKATLSRNDIEGVKEEISTLEAELVEKRAALAEVSKATEDEELRYGHEREKIVARISRADLIAYERIRKAKKGKAVVAVRKNACGGCFNTVPPQMILVLRKNDRLITCEHCGRILVSDEIVQESAASKA